MKGMLLRLLFPPKCAACGELLPFEGLSAEAPHPLCANCWAEWERERSAPCGCCGKTVGECVCLTEEQKRAKCMEFRKLVYYLHGTRRAVQNRVIYRIKDTPSVRVLSFLAQEMAVQARLCMKEHLIAREDAVIVYLPRSRAALLDRGTDQGKQLARALSAELEVPMLSVIRRRWGRKGRAQKHLNAAERRKNALATFTLKGRQVDLRSKAVLIVDDIVTTGTGMAAAVKLLRSWGAKEFYCFAVASDDTNQSPTLVQPVFRI